MTKSAWQKHVDAVMGQYKRDHEGKVDLKTVLKHASKTYKKSKKMKGGAQLNDTESANAAGLAMDQKTNENNNHTELSTTNHSGGKRFRKSKKSRKGGKKLKSRKVKRGGKKSRKSRKSRK